MTLEHSYLLFGCLLLLYLYKNVAYHSICTWDSLWAIYSIGMVAMRHIYIFTSSALTENRMRPNAQVFREYLTTHEFFINSCNKLPLGLLCSSSSLWKHSWSTKHICYSNGTCLPNMTRSPPLIRDILCVQDQKWSEINQSHCFELQICIE